MSLTSRCQPALVDTGSADEQGCLVFVDDRLVAVLVCLEPDEHVEPGFWHRWFVEAGFGPCQPDNGDRIFASQDEAVAWARERVSQRPDRRRA